MKPFTLEEEERCGHIVSENIKKLWSVQMDLAKVLDRICKKYGIKYFAAGGTLLGTIRHQGYIPWDDDMDFHMLKEDYDRFCEVAANELEPPYTLQKTFNVTRIRNANTTACTKRDLQNAVPPYNFGIFIDIFPLYVVPNNKFSQKTHLLQLNMMRRARAAENKIAVQEYRGVGKPSFNHNTMILKAITLLNKEPLLERYHKLCAKYEGQNSGRVGDTSFMPYNPKFIWEKSWFDKIIYMPFEDMELPVPEEYDLVLTRQYGDWHKLVKGTAWHEMPIYDAENPFTYYLDQLGK